MEEDYGIPSTPCCWRGWLAAQMGFQIGCQKGDTVEQTLDQHPDQQIGESSRGTGLDGLADTPMGAAVATRVVLALS
jgi:hypothetical protein